MKDTPLISVIIPSYYSENYIGECIRSIQKQTYKNWELIIVDGLSKDSTVEIVQKYQNRDNRLKLIMNPDDNGPAQARSKGIKISNGEYIAFIDSDDTWLPEKLEKQLKFMLQNDYKFSFTRYKKVYRDGTLSKSSLGGHKENTYKQYLRRRGIANSTVMINKICIDNEILNTCSKSHGEDTLWWLLIMKKGFNAYALQEILTLYRVVDGSLSSKVMNNQLTVWHSYRNELKLTFFEAAFYYVGYLMDVFFRRTIFIILNLFKK